MAAFNWDLGMLMAGSEKTFDDNIQSIANQVAAIENGSISMQSVNLGGTPSPTFTYTWGMSAVFLSTEMANSVATGFATGLQSIQSAIQFAEDYIEFGMPGASPITAGSIFTDTLLGGSSTLPRVRPMIRAN
jgi:hypothetical protein